MMKPIHKNLKKKGISPVIASIILIAVTIAIGVAIAGFVFGIFGTYSAAPNVSVTSSYLRATNGNLTIGLRNTGTGTVTGIFTYAVVDAGLPGEIGPA